MWAALERYWKPRCQRREGMGPISGNSASSAPKPRFCVCQTTFVRGCAELSHWWLQFRRRRDEHGQLRRARVTNLRAPGQNRSFYPRLANQQRTEKHRDGRNINLLSQQFTPLSSGSSSAAATRMGRQDESSRSTAFSGGGWAIPRGSWFHKPRWWWLGRLEMKP